MTLPRRARSGEEGAKCIAIPNPLLSGKKSGNSRFSKYVSAWTFQEELVLRIDAVSHHKLGESEAPEVYTTNDQIVRVPPSEPGTPTDQYHRCIPLTFPSMSLLPHHGFHTLASWTFNWNSPCWIPTSEFPFPPSQTLRESTRLPSEPQIDTASSSL